MTQGKITEKKERKEKEIDMKLDEKKYFNTTSLLYLGFEPPVKFFVPVAMAALAMVLLVHVFY